MGRIDFKLKREKEGKREQRTEKIKLEKVENKIKKEEEEVSRVQDQVLH